jgi:hypothetical protein
MKRILLITLLLAITISAYSFDALWQKAQELAENSWRLVPGTSALTMSYQAPGQRSPGFTVRISHTLGEDNEIISEIISFVAHDERFARDAELEDLADIAGSEQFVDLMEQMSEQLRPTHYSMFTETDTRNIRVRRTREQRRIGRRDTIGFNVRFTPEGRRGDRMEGTVFLCLETGSPILAEMVVPTLDARFNHNTSFSFDAENQRFMQTRNQVETVTQSWGMTVTVSLTLVMDGHWEFPEE